MTDRLPPANPEAEEALIASVIVDATALAETVSLVEPRAFFREKHGEIWSAIVDLWSRGEGVNLITLSHELARTDRLEKVGGMTFLADIVRLLPTTVGAEYYAGIVNDTAARRRLIAAGQAIIESGYADTSSPAALIDQATERLMRIGANRLRPLSLTLDEIMRGVPGVVESVSEQVQAWVEGPQASQRGIPIDWPAVDNALGGGQRGSMMTVLARTSVGKSFLAQWLAWGAAKRGHPVQIISTEMPFGEVATRLAYLEAGVDRLDYEIKASEDERLHARVNNAMGRVGELPITVTAAGKLAIRDVLGEMRRLKVARGIEMVVVDVLQDIRGRGDSPVERIREAITDIKAAAISLDVWAVVISHVSREAAKLGRLTVHSGLESGAIEQASDVVAALEPVTFVGPTQLDWMLIDELGVQRYQAWRNWCPVQLTILKNRHGEKVAPVRLLDWMQGGRLREYGEIANCVMPQGGGA